MEVTLLTQDSIKIKGKNSSFVVDPTTQLRVKTQADAVIVLTKVLDYSLSKIEESRVVIQGPGEYEVGGVKITGARADSNFSYNFLIDGIDVFLTSVLAISKIKEPRDYNMLIVQVNSVIDESLIAAFSPNIVVLYGEKAEEVFNVLGANKKTKTSKLTLKKEQLPTEMEVILLE